MTNSSADHRSETWLLGALVGGAALVASLPWLRALSSPGARWAVLAAAPVSVLVSAFVARVLRLRTLSGFAVSAAALLLVLLSSSGFDVNAFSSGLVNGPRRLLTETLPIGGTAVAAAVIVVVWIAGATAGETAFRAGPTSDVSGIAFVSPVASFVLAVAVTARAPGGDGAAAPILVVLLAAGAVARQRRKAGASPSLRAGEPVPVPTAATPGATRLVDNRFAAAVMPYRAVGLAVLGAVALAATVPALPGIGTTPVLVYEPPPANSHLLVDPVAAFGAMRDTRDPRQPHVIMRVRTDATSDGYLTAAVLDRFDGSQWTFESTFKPTGGRVPVPQGYDHPAFGTARVSASTTLESRLPVPLLPALERVSRVDGVPVAADAQSGMLAPDRRLSLPSHYTSVSDAPLLTLGGVPAVDGIESSPAPTPAPAYSGVQAPDDLQLPPDTSSALATAARFLAGITGRAPAPTVAFLQQALLAIRHDERRLDPTLGAGGGSGASGGTSLSQVMNAVTVNRSATPEQFATFIALVARYLGVPARLATGFRLQATGTGILPSGSHTVYDSDAWTWVEVPVSGMGWVVVDPTPTAATSLAAPPPEQVQVPPTTVPAQRANAIPRNQAAGGHAVAKPVTIGERARRGMPVWEVVVIVVSGVLVALLAGALGTVALRRRRSRMRFSDDPALLAGGAWLELLDALERAGMDVPTGSTNSEIAVEAGRYFGSGVPARVTEVGSVADRAMCSLLDPPSRDTALDAWNSQRALARDLYLSLPRRQRARMLLGGVRRRGASW